MSAFLCCSVHTEMKIGIGLREINFYKFFFFAVVKSFTGFIRILIHLLQSTQHSLLPLFYNLLWCFVVALLLKDVRLTPLLWYLLYWIVFLFSALNTSLHLFQQFPKAQRLFFFSYLSALTYWNALWLYTFLWILVNGIIAYFIFIAFLPHSFQTTFFSLLALAAYGFSSILSLLSFLVVRIAAHAALFALLALPVLLPLLMLIVEASIEPLTAQSAIKIFLLSTLFLFLAQVFVPFLWQDG